jgi:surface antigen
MTALIRNFLCIFTICSLVSCATKQQSGAGIGAVTGGLVGAVLGESTGNAFVGATFGTIIGGIAGSAIGKQMDENDKKLMSKATENALENSESGKKVAWKNPDNGNKGYVSPTKTYKVHGVYCREFVQEAIIGGQKVKVYGEACRKPDGQWQVVNSDDE